MEPKIRIAVVDDHPLFRGGVVRVLNESEKFDVVGEGATASEAVTLVSETTPDVILVDVHLPGGGLEAAESITAARSPTKIIVLSVVDDEQFVAKAFRIGVCGYLLKGVSASELIKSIESVAGGEFYLSPQLMGPLLGRLSKENSSPGSGPDPIVGFTEREEQILSLLSRGMCNKEIAFHIKISEKTVKYYLTHIMKKLRSKNRVEVALYASRRFLNNSNNIISFTTQ